MKYIKTIIASAAFMLSATTTQAQNTESGYFIDGYLSRHDMNPAIANDQNYISMPVLGNIDFSLNGNVGLQDFLYNVNGKTTLFTNPNVSTAEFLGNINDKNKIGTDIKMKLLGVGFKGLGGYNSIGINLRANLNTNIPGTLFRLAKEGLQNQSYDIRDFNIQSTEYVELALGHSHKLSEKLRIGATLKVLLGGANLDARFDKAEITFNGNDWTAVTNATVESSVKGLKYKTETTQRGAEGEKKPHTYVNDVDVKGAGLNGFGLAVDLGAEYKINNDWKLSAAVLDLGFISWSNNMVASTNGDRKFSLNKYTFNADKDAPNSFEKEMDRLTADLASLYELQDNGDKGGHSTGLAATANVGIEYTLPSYRKLSFGLLNTTRLNGNYTWTDVRLSANWAPAKVISMGANVAVGTYGTSFGWLLNVHPNGFNLFLGMDRTFGKLAKQGVPLSSNGSVNLGISFPF